MKQILINLLRKISSDILATHEPTIIGVTGNVGKTSMRTALVQFLSEFTEVGTNIENYNSEIGLPLSIIGVENPGKNPLGWLSVLWQGWQKTLSKDSDFPKIWVLELGIDQPGDMDFFVKDFLEFDVVVVGHVGKNPVHAENFENRDELIHEKAKILRGLKPDGLLLVNGDDSYIKHIYRKRKNVMTFGFDDAVDVQAIEFASTIEVDDSKTQWKKYHTSIVPQGRFKVVHKGSVIPFSLKYLVGKHQVYSILPAIALGIADGVNLVDISSKIQDFEPIKGRMQFMEGIKGSLLIDDSYNAAPAATFAAVDTLDALDIPESRKVAILGAMKEIGPDSGSVHASLGRQLAKKVDLFIGVGEEMKDAVDAFRKYAKKSQESHHFDDSEQLASWVTDQITANDIILVKGSQSTRMERVSVELMANKRYRKDLIPRQSDYWLAKE